MADIKPGPYFKDIQALRSLFFSNFKYSVIGHLEFEAIPWVKVGESQLRKQPQNVPQHATEKNGTLRLR